MKSTGLYIHVPFCSRKCAYCDFFSVRNPASIEKYMDALLCEIEESHDYLDGSSLSSIYFGGGTPSLLPEDYFQKIFERISRYYAWEEDAEITLEANPDDLTESYTKGLRHLPFNRISIGIQSFQDEELAFINRRHTAQQAIDTVKRCQENGLTNISIDLMFGLPGQTPDSFKDSIEQALQLNVQHISAYLLSLEPEVPLYKSLKKGLWQPASDEVTEEMYCLLCNKLVSAGFEHYEISNFAKPSFRSRHNSAYWQGIPYLGLGPSAHSFNRNSRRWNESSLKNYLLKDFRREEEILSLTDKYNDFILTRLRTREGIDLNELVRLYGVELSDYCLQSAAIRLQTHHLIQENGHLYLSPEAYFISDEIIRDLIKV